MIRFFWLIPNAIVGEEEAEKRERERKSNTYRLQMIFGWGKPSARHVILIFWFSRTATDDGVLSISNIFGGTTIVIHKKNEHFLWFISFLYHTLREISYKSYEKFVWQMTSLLAEEKKPTKRKSVKIWMVPVIWRRIPQCKIVIFIDHI